MFRGAKKRTFRFGKKNVSFPKVETFRFADYTMLNLKKTLSDKLKSVLSISADVKLMEPNSIVRSQGKSKRVWDKRVLV